MIQRQFKRVLSVVLAVVMLVCCLPVSAFASSGEGQVVLVGACKDFGVSVQGGVYSGFAYDYLNEIARFTGHRYSFVNGNCDDLFGMLADGKIDIIPCISAEEYALFCKKYPDSSAKLSGASLMEKFSAVYVREDSEEAIAFYDIEALNNATIGFLSGNESKYFSDGTFRQGDIDGANFVRYSTETQMQQDFYSGKIDAVVKECYRGWSNEKIVYQFDSNDCYFMTSGKDPLLVNQLDTQIFSVNLQNCRLASNLYRKHIAKYGVPRYAFSNDEKAYIEENPEITVAYNLSSSVIESYDRNSGTLSGTTGAVLSMIEQMSGFKIKLRICNTLADCVELLNSGEVQMICGGVNNGSMEQFGRNEISITYSSVPIVVAGKANNGITSYKKLAVPYDGDDIADYMGMIYPTATVLPYENIRGCMEAVEKGEADVVCAGAYETIYMINNGYSDMMILGVTASKHGESFAYSETVPAVLPDIIGKCIMQLTTYSEVSAAMDGAGGSVVIGHSGIPIEMIYVIIAVLIFIIFGVVLMALLAHMKIRRTNLIDPLTGGRNKQKLIEDTKKILKKIPAENFAVALFDINKFKFVNDRLGYEEGDRMLLRLHKTIQDQLDDGELFGRLSDDNFALVIKNAPDNEITVRLNNLFSEFERRNNMFVKYPVAFSAGVCHLGQCRDSGKDIDLNVAIDRCKIAKRTLKGLHYSSIAFYDGKIRDKALREKDYEAIMPTALIQREFECYLQPKYGLQSRHIEGAEALIRWNSKEFGFVFPNDFIPLSEKNGFVVELDFFILEEVCRAMRRWLDEGKTPVVISVNQSRLHLNYDDYIWRLREIVDKYEIPYEYIELELTESVFTENAEQLLVIMQKLHDIGFKLSLDDFGSGYSSLNMLKDIPVDVVKIDREFFNGTVNSEKGRAVISTVVDLAKNLNMEVISEGVETLEQVEFLTEINCAMVQGYYFAKPMNIAAFEELWNEDLALIAVEAENQ